jgi:glycosyltransferase involved in cell wall biosynthesis
MQVSVYMPTKDRQSSAAEAIASVLDQTYPHVELIVVNDGSTDDTFDYLEQLSRRDTRVKVIHNEHAMGAPRSRNSAIRSATGDFVTGLDDDDRFHPNRLAALVAYWRLLEESGERFSCLYTQDVFMHSSPRRLSKKRGSVSAQDLFPCNEIGNQVFTRREYLIGAGLFDEHMPAWQDLDLFIRLLGKYGPAKLLDSGLYFFDDQPRPDRISKASKDKILSAYRRLADKNGEATPEMKQALFLQAFSRYYRFRPGSEDFAEFGKYGFSLKNTARVAKLVGVLTALQLRRLMGTN